MNPLDMKIAILFRVAALAVLSLLTACDSQAPAEPRAITARGDLADSEQSTIQLFETAGPSVVYINTTGRREERCVFAR